MRSAPTRATGWVALLGAAALVLAGCSSHHPHNTTTTSGSTTSSSPTGSSSTSSSTSSSIPGSSSTTTSTAVAAANQCGPSSVAVAVHAGPGVTPPLTGTASYTVAVTDTTQRPCSVDGYATVSLLGSKGAPVVLAAGTQVPGTPALAAPAKVTIQPGTSAVFGIGVVTTHKVSGSKHPQPCNAETAASVTLPGSSVAISWTGGFTVCSGGVGAFVAAPATECNMDQLVFAATAESGSTTGHTSVLVEMKNGAAAACTLTGDPVAWYENSTGTAISATSAIPAKQAPSQVTVKAHSKATVTVFSVLPSSVSAASCGAAATATLVIAAPDQGQLVKLPVDVTVCTKTGENGLTTSPVH